MFGEEDKTYELRENSIYCYEISDFTRQGFLTWKWAKVKEVKEDLVEADNFAYCVCKKKKQQASKMY